MAANITIEEALLDFGGGGFPIDILVPPGGGGPAGGNQTSAQVSWRMQGGRFIPGSSSLLRAAIKADPIPVIFKGLKKLFFTGPVFTAFLNC